MADSTFPAANVDAELNPGTNKNFEEDSGSSLVTTSKEIKVIFLTLEFLFSQILVRNHKLLIKNRTREY